MHVVQQVLTLCPPHSPFLETHVSELQTCEGPEGRLHGQQEAGVGTIWRAAHSLAVRGDAPGRQQRLSCGPV